jgi:RNA polymerase sigma-70 factor (ECF subfamily)
VQQAPDDLAAFCAREYPKLVGALHLYCGDRHVAEEMAQEALLRACRDWPRIRRLGSPGGYTRRIAVNLATSHFRRRQAERRATERLAARDTGEPATADPADGLAVRQALLRLPPKQRMAVVLRFYLDLPVAEVAAATGVPLGTAKSLLSRATPLLEQHLRVRDPIDLEEARRERRPA